MNSKKTDQIEALIKKRKFKDAEKKLKAISKGKALSAELNYLTYLIELERGAAQKAFSHIAKACSQEPGNAKYLNLLGKIYLDANEYKQAENCFRNCISLDENNADYWCRYGTSQQLLDNFDEALRAYRHAIQLSDRTIEAYLQIARLKQYQRQHQEALQMLDQAESVDPDSSELFTLRGQIQQEAGLTEAATESYLHAHELDSENLECLYYLSMLNPHGLDGATIEEIKRRKITDPKNRISRQFILAAHYRSVMNYKDEIKHLIKGHEIFRKNLSNGETRRSNTLNKVIAMPELEKNISVSVDPSDTQRKPIFLVGSPRSGSTLLESLLATSSSEPMSLEESGVFSYAASIKLMPQLDSKRDRVLAVDDSFAKLVSQSYRGKGLQPETPRFTDKSLENIFYVDIILSVFPDAKFIYCNRNPVASLVSILQNNLASLSWAHDIPAILQYVDATRRAANIWTEKYPKQFYDFNYEGFVQAPEEQAAPVFQFCELEWKPENMAQLGSKGVSQTASNVQIRQGINTKGLERYKNYLSFFEEYKNQYSWLNEA